MAGRFPSRNYGPRPRRDRAPRPDGSPAPADARPGAGAPSRERSRRGGGGDWERPAGWYDQLQGDEGSEFHRTMLLPAVRTRLQAPPGGLVLDLGCGQGVVGRFLASLGVRSVGVDLAAEMIAGARARAGDLERYVQGDARELRAALAALPPAERGPFDGATLVMAAQDIDPIAPVLSGAGAALKPGARLVLALTHPCFRIPRRSSWGFDEEQGVQYRRLDGYLSPLAAPIRIHPGQADPTTTTTYHRPLHAYLNALGAAGLGIVACDELTSHRRGTKGPRFGAEDRAAREFPLFLVLTCHRLA